jgi:hypothetical protein
VNVDLTLLPEVFGFVIFDFSEVFGFIIFDFSEVTDRCRSFVTEPVLLAKGFTVIVVESSVNELVYGGC